jgi:hypothetical protein
MRHNTGIYPYTNHAGLRYIAHVSLEVSSFFFEGNRRGSAPTGNLLDLCEKKEKLRVQTLRHKKRNKKNK